MRKMTKDMEDGCKTTPAPAMLPLSSMTSEQVGAISCLAFAEGAYVAHTLGRPHESYDKLSTRRTFAQHACLANPKRFKDDIFRLGPDYVLKQRY
jgi:hypothetical protein